MKIVLPVAGNGIRLRPYTENMPKCLLPVAGKTIIDWIVEVTITYAEIDFVPAFCQLMVGQAHFNPHQVGIFWQFNLFRPCGTYNILAAVADAESELAIMYH